MQGAGFGIRVHHRMLGAELRRNLEGIVREPRGKPLLDLGLRPPPCPDLSSGECQSARPLWRRRLAAPATRHSRPRLQTGAAADRSAARAARAACRTGRTGRSVGGEGLGFRV